MAFTVKHEFGSVATPKADERVNVQLVEVNGKLRLELRVFVDNANYTGATRSCVPLKSQADVSALMALMKEAAKQLPKS